MEERAFDAADILLPKVEDLHRWSVVACDQYTSQPEYWQQVHELVGQAPSTLALTLPEVYLGTPEAEGYIRSIVETMQRYLDEGLFTEYPHRFLYIERTLQSGVVRHGLVGMVDLEQYDYRAGSKSRIRATEGTVLSRIPPRVAVRKDAPLELPHVMLLIDDPTHSVIEPLAGRKGELEQAYDFDLMQQGGHIAGYLVPEPLAQQLRAALDRLGDQDVFEQKYGLPGEPVLQYAVGDGNHSLATAKACYEALREQLPPEELRRHPARYALVELVDLHDDALIFEPIHRIVTGVDPTQLLDALRTQLAAAPGAGEGQQLQVVLGGKAERWHIGHPSSNLAVGSLQQFLDDYLAQHGGEVDYIHGDEVLCGLTQQADSVGFLLPAMQKEQLFPTVILDGALPRKTFSMGHACDKRFYLEARRIR